MNKKITLLIDLAVKALDKENRRFTDSNIIMKLREFSDIEISRIFCDNA